MKSRGQNRDETASTQPAARPFDMPLGLSYLETMGRWCRALTAATSSDVGEAGRSA
jgi:hypothetical protein